MTDCLFCKIIASEIPCAKVYEDDDILAFLDINPVTWGHTLVVPKNHSENVLDITEDDLSKIILICKKIGKSLIEKVDADAFNIMHATGAQAQQTVFHTHFHVIPRRKTDNFDAFPRPRYNDVEPEKTAETIKSAFLQ